MSAKVIRAKSPGKLNLTFDIVGDLPNGYHQVETLMQALELEDQLAFRVEKSDSFSISLLKVENFAVSGVVPTDESNLINKAARLFHQNYKGDFNYKIEVEMIKCVPIAGGMGGGSGNAAATLMVCNKIADNPMPDGDIYKLAAMLGADVPFFINGGLQLGKGRGDELSPVKTNLQLWFVIVSPRGVGLSTPSIYKEYDAMESERTNKSRPNLAACVRALESDNLLEAAKHFGNVFESVVFSQHAELREMFNGLAEFGGLTRRLTGSGPTMYIPATSLEQAEAIGHALLDSDLDADFMVACSSRTGVQIEAI